MAHNANNGNNAYSAHSRPDPDQLLEQLRGNEARARLGKLRMPPNMLKTN